jgi:hypothetical protein
MITKTAVYASMSNKNGKIEFILLWLQSILENKCVKLAIALLRAMPTASTLDMLMSGVML